MSSIRHEPIDQFNLQIRAKSPHKKCAIRYDKLYIDNTPYVYDDERGTVVRYFAQEPLRSGSRTNYSSLDGGLLVRSTSFPSVNGADQSMSLSTNNLDRGGSRTSLGSRRGDYASTESLHMTPAPPVNALPPTDENAEVQEVSFLIFFRNVLMKLLRARQQFAAKKQNYGVI